MRAALDLGPPVTAVARATFARAASSQGERLAARAGLPAGSRARSAAAEAAGFASRVGHAHYDTRRAGRLPAALLRRRRDHFGAHGSPRTDRPGAFRTHRATPDRVETPI
ncbi:hypothetical protein ELQ87_35955 [Streptomyces griseoviridis]|uniref:Uncharacterized protein n=1 Tax=Streptomyces griseoviridis TaxID=45398 RepID=A0A3S9ZMY0_STRGD|nr:hypothetical protein ELQ87_35955 [Streptomyces griseoviridis]QCN84114.1 hypothetical protein DDJ31_03290 [Streptomyces griseoviridis]